MDKVIPSRRVVMRSALAVGCSLWMPIALSATATGEKVPQASVQYQPKPKGDQKCASCMNFIAGSSTCKLVEGQVSPQGWCSLWVKKA